MLLEEVGVMLNVGNSENEEERALMGGPGGPVPEDGQTQEKAGLKSYGSNWSGLSTLCADLMNDEGAAKPRYALRSYGSNFSSASSGDVGFRATGGFGALTGALVEASTRNGLTNSPKHEGGRLTPSNNTVLKSFGSNLSGSNVALEPKEFKMVRYQSSDMSQLKPMLQELFPLTENQQPPQQQQQQPQYAVQQHPHHMHHHHQQQQQQQQQHHHHHHQQQQHSSHGQHGSKQKTLVASSPAGTGDGLLIPFDEPEKQLMSYISDNTLDKLHATGFPASFDLAAGNRITQENGSDPQQNLVQTPPPGLTATVHKIDYFGGKPLTPMLREAQPSPTSSAQKQIEQQAIMQQQVMLQQQQQKREEQEQQQPQRRKGLRKKKSSGTKRSYDSVSERFGNCNIQGSESEHDMMESRPSKRLTSSSSSSENLEGGRNNSGWTIQEDKLLREAVKTCQGRQWKKIAEKVPGRTHTQCMQRWDKVLKPNRKKGSWTQEEDAKLTSLVQATNAPEWAKISEAIPGRCGKQCRERWTQSLDPSIKREDWTEQEDRNLLTLHAELGNKWANIRAHLQGRTESQIKNRYKTLIQAHQKDATVIWTDELQQKLESLIAEHDDIKKIKKHLPREIKGITLMTLRQKVEEFRHRQQLEQ